MGTVRGLKLRSVEPTLQTTFGWSLLALGIVLNEWFLTALLSPDGVIGQASSRMAIWFVDIVCIVMGIVILSHAYKTRNSSRAWARVAIVVAMGLVYVAGAELIVRFLGYQPWRLKDTQVSVEPGGRFFQKHSTLGYSHLPGRFRVTLHDGYSFNVTHQSSALRITHPPRQSDLQNQRPEIWIFGCSLTHGWSLNDEETYPWLLQEAFPDYEVVNFGVGGYGTLQSYLQLREALENGGNPELVIVAYNSFHDARNVFTRARRKIVITWNKLGPLEQPYASINEKKELSYHMDEVVYRPVPLMQYSALVHLAEEAYNRIEDRLEKQHEVSKAIIRDMYGSTQRSGSKFVIAGMTGNALTYELLEHFRREGIMAVDISVDMAIRENTNLPHDKHPSPLANRKYATRLASYLHGAVLESDLNSPGE